MKNKQYNFDELFSDDYFRLKWTHVESRVNIGEPRQIF